MNKSDDCSNHPISVLLIFAVNIRINKRETKRNNENFRYNNSFCFGMGDELMLTKSNIEHNT